jgi:hypothetical protein
MTQTDVIPSPDERGQFRTIGSKSGYVDTDIEFFDLKPTGITSSHRIRQQQVVRLRLIQNGTAAIFRPRTKSVHDTRRIYRRIVNVVALGS